MEHLIELTNGTARMLEYFGEAATVRGKYVGIDGDEEWTSIKVQCASLYDWIFNNNRSPGPPNKRRLQYQISQVNRSEVIETPVFFSALNEAAYIELIDGRHRICALHQLGAKSIVIMVPESQQEMFYNQFGQG